MRILFYDLETAPSMAYVWKIWQENIGINQLLEAGKVISFSAKFYGEEDIYGMTEFHDGHAEMVSGLFQLMEEADVIVAYNGNKFDRPVMNAEFLKYGFGPPPPSKQIDLYQTVKRNFRFVSNRLDYVCRFLGLEGKAETGGFKLWSDCLAGVESAWDTMLEYNMKDVEILENLYVRLLPWIKDHPNAALYSEKQDVCPNCGGTHIQSRGVAKTATVSYRRFQCMDCLTWMRSRLSEKDSFKPSMIGDKTR